MDLNSLAAVHLGRAGDGTIVKPYVTPDNVDSSLLVGVPRYLNRMGYDIDDKKLPFVGVDAWNAYEFSTLLTNGFPVSGWLKFVYPADTPNIVESKSAKLYLNSYNMARLIDTVDDLHVVREMIERDLSQAVGGPVVANINIGDVSTVNPIRGVDFYQLETICDVHNMLFDRYNEDPSTLQVVNNRYSSQSHGYRSHVLRSNCRVTNQPDWGDIYIYSSGTKSVTPESLLQYIVSMRKENHFHEEICECVYKRLHDILQPDELFVGCLYSRRGGIDINPIRASNKELLQQIAPIIHSYNFCTKTSKQ